MKQVTRKPTTPRQQPLPAGTFVLRVGGFSVVVLGDGSAMKTWSMCGAHPRDWQDGVSPENLFIRRRGFAALIGT